MMKIHYIGACGVCGRDIPENSGFTVCPDCGMFFCERCVEEHGTRVPEHDCDEEGDMGYEEY